MVRLQVLNQARQVQMLPSVFYKENNFLKLLTVQWCMDRLFSLIFLFSVCVTLEELERLLNMKGKRVSSFPRRMRVLLEDGEAWSGEVLFSDDHATPRGIKSRWHFKGSPWNPVIDGVACCIQSQPHPDQGHLRAGHLISGRLSVLTVKRRDPFRMHRVVGE